MTRASQLSSLAGALLLALSTVPAAPVVQAQADHLPGTVVSIADGDTIVVELADGARERVRLIGLNAPETKHPSKPVQCFGPEATARTTELALGKAVGLELDVQQRDQFGRMLAYVWPEGSMLMLNEQLAAEGYALPLTVPPNVRHAEQFRQAASSARENSLGLWAGCQVDGAPTEAADYEGTIEDQVAEASAPPPGPTSAPAAPPTPTPVAPTPAPTPTPDFGPRCSDILASTPNRGGPTIDQQWGICMGLGEKHGAPGVDCYARATQKTAALIGKISTETHNALFDAELTVCTASIR